ncbi:family 78 glycoside hydrolase catalytic domain [Xylanibacter brevis]|uniref:family 78 glycoside hydrolase catalytic domain n=1 Tax=Xylanibacter brevis TaxID=83231 RepID=UPI0005C45B70|nr:family 78 glycoside hydrolase catalytic domain [Xylanibacter brevis]
MKNYLLLFAVFMTQVAAADVIELRCEGLKDPLGIDTTTPHFSWQNTLTHRGQRQTAYEIEVAKDSFALSKGQLLLWKSGRMESANQVMVAYGGPVLQPRQLCYWRVRTWDEKGRCSSWSRIARFAVGALDGMKGQYVTAASGQQIAPTCKVRSAFVVNDVERPVFAYVNSLGYHELYVNGQRVGRQVLQPAMSQLDRHSLVVTYDITPYLHKGNNEMMLWMGQGWNRAITFHTSFEGPLVKAEVSQLMNDHWQTLLQTNGSWQATASPYSYTGSWFPLQFGGERYDANVVDTWSQATVFNVGNMRTTPQLFEGNEITDRLLPKTISRLADGSLLIDFGRVITGWLTVDFEHLKHKEEVQIDYTDYIPRGASFTKQANSDNGDVYVASGSMQTEHFENKFHLHAFRYVRVSTQQVKRIEALQISALPKEGSEVSAFACSDQRLNAVHNMIHYTMQCLTMSGYMVDCPHLERMGYGGDGNSSTMTLQTMYNVAPTYMNWLSAWEDVMDEDGSLPHVAPAGGGGGGPYWCGFMVKAPWRSYLNYGDIRFVERYYPLMKRWMSYVEKYMVDGLLQPWPDTQNRVWFLGDWLAPDGVDVGGESVIHANNCFISDCLGNMAEMARWLNKPDEARLFAAKRERLNKRIHDSFYHAETHTYANGTPLDMCYAMLAGIVPDSLYDKVKSQLIADSYQKYNAHIAAGLFGVPVFTEWAVRNQQSDLMATILRQPDYPGYLHMINNGATTTWEYWNGERSRVHNCYNGIGTWFYQALAGITIDTQQPGYRHITIRPQQTEGVSWVQARVPTPYGDVSVRWKKKALRVELPVGVTADVIWGDKKHTIGSGVWRFNKY